MRQLLQNKALRQLTLIEMLMDSDRPLDLTYLSETLNTSSRTLKMDMSELNQAMPFLQITSQLGMVDIQHDENTGFSHIYQHFIRYDLHFNILHLVFFEKDMTISKLSQRLYISEASIYRAIRSINQSLQELGFDVHILQTPCIITGNEVDVRRFYYNLLFESYSILEWPFDFIEYEAFTYALQAIAKEFHIQLYLSNMQKLSIIVGVNLTRHFQGHYLEDLHPTDYFNTDKLQAKVASHLESAVEGIHQENWSTKDTLNVFFPFFHPHYAYNYSYFIHRAGEDPVFNQSFLWINHMIETLRYQYNIRFTDTESLILSLHNNACLGLLTPGSYPVLHSGPLTSVDIVERWSPQFYLTMRELIENYLQLVFNKNHPYIIDYVLFQLIVHLQDYLELYMSDANKLSIAIISHYNYTHAQYYQRVLQMLMPKQLTLSILDDYGEFPSQLQARNYDILVSSCHIKVPEGMTFCKLSYIPTSDELSALMALIQNIRIGKVKPGQAL